MRSRASHTSNGVATCTKTKPPYASIISRTSFRVRWYGAIGAQIAMPRFFVISEATNPMRWMFRSRCFLLKPSSLERCVRTMSPSNNVTGRPPRSFSFATRICAIVDLPAPDNPVKNTVNPCRWRGGYVLRNSSMTSG